MTQSARAVSSPDRMTRAAAQADVAGLDALLVSPGPDLRYLTGYDALPLERLTCLVVRPADDPLLVVLRSSSMRRRGRRPVRWVCRSSRGTRGRIRTPLSRRSFAAPSRSLSTTTCGRRRC